MDKVKILYLSNKNLSKLPNLSSYVNLEYLLCENNRLTSLDYIPKSVTHLYCSNNMLRTIDNLPKNITHLYCSKNMLTSLDKLPNSITNLDCSNNLLTSLDKLPESIQCLWCYKNILKSLNNLPKSLNHLICYDNKIESLAVLPESITFLSCKLNNFNYPFEETLTNIKIYNKCRFTYYLNKYSNKLKKCHLRFRTNRCNKYKEELMMKVWHPKNINKFPYWLGEED